MANTNCGGLLIDETTLSVDATTKKLGVKAGTFSVPNASTTTKGIVNQATNQVDSVATTVEDLVLDFNALLAKLKLAGIMVAD